MELAAVVMVPSRENLSAIEEVQPYAPAASENLRPLYTSRAPILGNDVLRSWMEPVRKLGVRTLWLTSCPSEDSVPSDLARFAKQGIERFLMIKLKSYAEMDLADFLRFHRETRNVVTEAKDYRGRLGVSFLDGPALKTANQEHEFRTQAPYQFRGYAKRILSAKERQELVGDALTGACAMRPSGMQIREQVWIGEGASLANSARVVGPTYIGARTMVRAGATIGPFVSVERDCVVGCGTAVEQATVLPHTYLAPGLLIRRALVDGGRLEDLRSGVIADLQPAGLGTKIQTPRRNAVIEPITERPFCPGGAATWGCTPPPPSNASQPWLQVQL